MEKNKYSKIVKKVRGLLAIAKDENKDEESQSAFLMAQKLMIQYDIDKSEVLEDGEEPEPINEESVTIYKKLFWWERQLGTIIAKNFRVKMFYNSRKENNDQKKKSRIVFYGFGKDLELAKEMYILAYEVLLFHAKNYIDTWYKEEEISRVRYVTESVKTSYIRGFLAGLESRFKDQVAELTERYEVMVLVPKEVENSYKEYSKDFGVYTTEIPPVSILTAYSKGVEEAEKVDFTKRTVGTNYSSLVGQYICFNEGVTRGLVAKIISVVDKQLQLLIMNTVSTGLSEKEPQFYSWYLEADYDFEVLTRNDERVKRFNIFESEGRYKNQIDKALKELG